jgi:hypothetical protein
MNTYENTYEGFRRITYGKEGATFVPVCETCGRFVKADKTVRIGEYLGLHPGMNATCKKCGRTRMLFEGFV